MRWGTLCLEFWIYLDMYFKHFSYSMIISECLWIMFALKRENDWQIFDLRNASKSDLRHLLTGTANLQLVWTAGGWKGNKDGGKMPLSRKNYRWRKKYLPHNIYIHIYIYIRITFYVATVSEISRLSQLSFARIAKTTKHRHEIMLICIETFGEQAEHAGMTCFRNVCFVFIK